MTLVEKKYQELVKEALKRIQFKNDRIEALIILCQKILSDEIFHGHAFKRREFNSKLDKIMDTMLERDLNNDSK